MITSPTNPKIKDIAALHRSRRRKKSGLTLAEGSRLTREALEHADVQTLILSESMEENRAGIELTGLADRKKIETLRISDRCYQKISGLKTPEGAAAVIRFRPAPLEVLLTPDARLVIPAGIQDPGNAGAIVRTAEAAGFSGCIMAEGVDPSHPAFLRASAGSAFRLPLAETDFEALIKTVKSAGIRLLAAAGQGEGCAYRKIDYRPPLAICVGSEGAGLPEEVEDAASEVIRIPMAGKIESLNVAVAAGIIFYQAREYWRFMTD